MRNFAIALLTKYYGIRAMKSKGMRWAEHVAYIGQMKNATSRTYL
jgi:hypothetical protein